MPAETPVRFHPEADEEVHVIADWYDEHGQGGELFLEALGDAPGQAESRGELAGAALHRPEVHWT